jgi:hypothetical protein
MMNKMRLNGWHRIGILISVIFMIGSAFYQRLEQAELEILRHRVAYLGKSICVENARANIPAPPAGFVLDAETACINDYEKAIDGIFAFTNIKMMDIIYHAIFPVLAAWIIAYFLIFTFRWIRRGFEGT